VNIATQYNYFLASFKQWKINYYSQSVKKDESRLPLSIKAKFEAILDKMLEYGPDLGLPFTRAMGKGLFEIRAKG
jgi:phage-related protein